MWTPKKALELLDALSALGSPEALFKDVHPMGHGVASYRRYCERRRRFNSGSESLVLCDCLQLIVDEARRREVGRVLAEEWDTVVAVAIRRHPGPLAAQRAKAGQRGSQVTEAHAERLDAPYGRLDDRHQRFIAAQVAELLVVASEPSNAMNRVARWQVRNTLWRWTVDAVDTEGVVRIDGARSSRDLWPITRKAQSAAPGAKLVHEHVVPRGVIASQLLASELRSMDAVFHALRRHCLAAVVTKDEDNLLNERGFKQAMPDGWTWGDDPWARYRVTGLYDELIWPQDWPTDLPGGCRDS